VNLPFCVPGNQRKGAFLSQRSGKKRRVDPFNEAGMKARAVEKKEEERFFRPFWSSEKSAKKKRREKKRRF